MPILRQKSGRPNAAEYQRPLVLQRFRAIARTLPGAPSEHELAQLAVQMQNYMEVSACACVARKGTGM